MVARYGVDPYSDNAGISFVSRAMDSRFLNDAYHAAATIEGAAQSALAGAAPGVTLSAVNAGSGAVTTRTSFATPQMDISRAVALHQDQDGRLSLSGLSAGNMANGFGLWFMPLYQNDNVHGMKSGNFKTGYNSNLGGAALGADFTFDDAYRVGINLNVGGGSASSTGDFNKTKNSFSFWGLGLYGGWKQGNYALSADLGYTATDSNITQSLPSSMQMNSLKADVKNQAFTVGMRAEYKLESSAVDITPYLGLRYTYLSTGGYNVKSSGTVFSVARSIQNLWTFPIGVVFSKTFDQGNGWSLTPQANLAVIPAFGALKAKSTSRISGVATTASLETQIVDRFTWQSGLGFDMKNEALTLGLSYNIQASQHRTGHGLSATLRYEF